ncbi:MAG: HEPN domain-containing protein [Desulfurococcales archaeon]|nr:HEPN domain-containing protein [Desulfurococcales archaeon]
MSNEEIAEKWLRKAYTDLRVAEKLFEIGEEPWVIVFHAQQAVEKALKAYLVLHNRHFGKTHNLSQLIDLCSEIDQGFQQLYELEVDELYPLAIEARYPDTGIEITIDEAKEAIEKARTAISFITRKIESKKS